MHEIRSTSDEPLKEWVTRKMHLLDAFETCAPSRCSLPYCGVGRAPCHTDISETLCAVHDCRSHTSPPEMTSSDSDSDYSSPSLLLPI
jgi:hypothetical protein